jgi:hypothetical protein
MNAEQMEEIKRHFGVLSEALRSDIRQIAEGHATIRHELQEHRGEIRDEFKEMRASCGSYFPSSTNASTPSKRTSLP